MKRSDITEGTTVAYMYSSFGVERPREVVVLDAGRWTNSYSRGNVHTFTGPNGAEYSVAGWKRTDRPSQGVLVGWPKGGQAFVVQLNRLQPWAEAKAAFDASEAAIQAKWDARDAREALLEARTTRVLKALGIALPGDGSERPTHSDLVRVKIDDLETLAEALGWNPNHDDAECLLDSHHDGACLTA